MKHAFAISCQNQILCALLAGANHQSVSLFPLPFRNHCRKICCSYICHVFFSILIIAILIAMPASRVLALSLDRILISMGHELVYRGDLHRHPVMVCTHDFYDAVNGLSLPLASQMRSKMITALNVNKVKIHLDGADDNQVAFFQGTWQRMGDKLSLDMRVVQFGAGGPEILASASRLVELAEVDPVLFTPDRDSWARYIVRRLEENTAVRTLQPVCLQQFVIHDPALNQELGLYLTGWLQPALSQSRWFRPVDANPSDRELADQPLPPQGLASGNPLSVVQNNPAIVDEDAILGGMPSDRGYVRGEAWRHQESIEVRIVIHDAAGAQVSAASADIPQTMFPDRLLVPSETTGSHHLIPLLSNRLSRAGLIIELATERGADLPEYREVEWIRFILRLNRPSYVYLFNIDPTGQAFLCFTASSTFLSSSACKTTVVYRRERGNRISDF